MCVFYSCVYCWGWWNVLKVFHTHTHTYEHTYKYVCVCMLVKDRWIAVIVSEEIQNISCWSQIASGSSVSMETHQKGDVTGVLWQNTLLTSNLQNQQPPDTSCPLFHNKTSVCARTYTHRNSSVVRSSNSDVTSSSSYISTLIIIIKLSVHVSAYLCLLAARAPCACPPAYRLYEGRSGNALLACPQVQSASRSRRSAAIPLINTRSIQDIDTRSECDQLAYSTGGKISHLHGDKKKSFY